MLEKKRLKEGEICMNLKYLNKIGKSYIYMTDFNILQ